MSLSARSSLLLRRSLRSPPPRCWSPLAMLARFLEVQAGFARGVRQGLDPAVIDVAAAVEHDIFEALFQGAFGHQLADPDGGVLVGALGPLLAAFQRRGVRQRDAAGIVDDLGVDVLRRTEDRQARTTAGQGLQPRTVAPGATFGGGELRNRHDYFFLPSLRRTASPA